MQHEVLLLSVRPTFVRRILEGTKTVELRRIRPHVVPGQHVLIYSSAPTMALLASAVVERLAAASPDSLWSQVAGLAGVSRAEYDAYFRDAERAVAIWLGGVAAFDRPIPSRNCGSAGRGSDHPRAFASYVRPSSSESGKWRRWPLA